MSRVEWFEPFRSNLLLEILRCLVRILQASRWPQFRPLIERFQKRPRDFNLLQLLRSAQHRLVTLR